MIKKITPYKQSLRGNDHMILVDVDGYDTKSQRVLVSLNNKVAEATYNPKSKRATAKLDLVTANQNIPMAALLPQNPDIRVKAFVYDFLKDKIIAAKLQEFEYFPQLLDYKPSDELLSTSPVIIGDWDKKGLVERAMKEQKIKINYFIKSWWSDENDIPIKEALLNDTVKFHLETQNIPDNEIVFITLYDDDKRVNLKEDGKNDKLKLVYSSSGKEVIYAKVLKNKVTLTLKLENFDSFLKKEADGTLELFFACSYVNPKTKISFNKDLPKSINDYLKVKGMPKIIFVNGHWNRIANKIGLSPGSGGKKYWDFFNSNLDSFILEANNFFNIKSRDIKYIDGSSLFGGDENGQERKNRGYKYANDNFFDLTKSLGNESIYLISHSEGGACAAGVAKLLIEKGIKIGSSLMLSTDEGDEFEIEENYECYQITAGYLVEDKISNKNIFHVDPVVLDNKIKGISKYGIFISKNSDFFTTHGSTINNNTFKLINVLKSIQVQKALNSKGNTVYVTNPVDESWYKIDDYILYNKRIDLYPVMNKTINEYFEERQD